MTLISWNVNGLRAVMKKGFGDFIATHQPDILCLQEIKASEADIPKLEIPYSCQYYHSAEKKGYSGTAIFSQNPADGVSLEWPDRTVHPQEGRVQVADFGRFYLVNVYVPNSQNELRRLDYRTGVFDPQFRELLVSLNKTKPVVVCGDFNVAHEEIDIARPKANRRNAGFTDEEREEFTKHLEGGFIDTFRHRNPDLAEQYTWWSFRAGARGRNIGWRIDYFLISRDLEPHLADAFILSDVMGSDHCPLGIRLSWR
ncbi:exodeoxyribonuclease III [Ruficoccus sp. ZRK36]|uniref:exodeoxyribonuclease III n=1 Tax=Ruficoccus sp. ZRK36 TaxID=2866311 RepID=UPI001C73936E|nr:exodeoxyribonuclease III [Ruficoccus sp. ZRK36]